MASTSTAPRVCALSIAGSDSGGGAGVVADVATFLALGVHPTVAITAVTAQNTLGVQAVSPVPAPMVAQQVAAVLDDLPVQAIKTGMLANAEVVAAVAAALGDHDAHPALVIDPVLRSTSGQVLLDDAGLAALRKRLMPKAKVLTPNWIEANVLCGRPTSVEAPDKGAIVEVARTLHGLAPAAWIVITGGDSPLSTERVSDCVIAPDGTLRWRHAPRLVTTATHGSGCVFSAGISALMARGADPLEAIDGARQHIHGAMAAAAPLGRGRGPSHALWRLNEAPTRPRGKQ